MTKQMTTVVDDLAHAVEASRTRLEQSAADLTRRSEEQRTLTLEAEADEAEIAQLEERRQALLRPAMLDHHPAAIAELDTIPKRTAILELRARFARETAKGLQPAIDALAGPHQAIARAVSRAEYAVLERDHAVRSAAVQAALDALEPEIVAWKQSAERIEHEHRARFGEPRRATTDGAIALRIMRWWSQKSHALFGRLFGQQSLDALEYNFGNTPSTLD